MRELQSLSLHSWGLLKAAISTLCAGCANRTVFGTQIWCAIQQLWVRAQRCMQLPADAAELAAASGSVPMLRLLQQKGVLFTSTTSCQAAASGHLGALQFLYIKVYVIGWDAVCAAAERGHLALLRFLHGVGYNMSHRRVVRAAVVGGSVEVMAWLLEHGVERTAELLYKAATSYHKPLLFSFLYEQRNRPFELECTEPAIFVIVASMAQEGAAAAPAAVMMSASELASYNGISQGALVYVALDGEVYDVTSAAGMYGPGGPYNGA
jgi:hypothetical protein